MTATQEKVDAASVQAALGRVDEEIADVEAEIRRKQRAIAQSTLRGDPRPATTAALRERLQQLRDARAGLEQLRFVVEEQCLADVSGARKAEVRDMERELENVSARISESPVDHSYDSPWARLLGQRDAIRGELSKLHDYANQAEARRLDFRAAHADVFT